MNELGSDEHSRKEFKRLEEREEEILTGLHEIVSVGDEAKAAWNSKFGLRVREVLVTEKLACMKACAEAGTPEQHKDAQFQYEVICKVTNIMAGIIVQSKQALEELNQLHR